MMRLSLTIRHEILSGAFCDAGLKNDATALLVVVDSIRRLTGGGEMSLSADADRLRLIERDGDDAPRTIAMFSCSLRRGKRNRTVYLMNE